MNDFPSYLQLDEKDCGPACLKMILKYYGKYVDLDKIIELSETNRTGTTLLGLSKAAETLHLKTTGARVSYEVLSENVNLPCIAFWQQKHFVVIYKIKGDKIFISDPAYGLISYNKKEFLQNWTNGQGTSEGIVLMLEPTSDFHSEDNGGEKKVNSYSAFIWHHINRYKGLLFQLIFSLLAGCMIQFAFPFLTQALVDNGVQNQNINFIYLVLLAQLMLFLGKVSLEVIRNYILMHIGTRLQISLVSEFFIKLMKLPISFFDSKVTGDLVQRLNDHKKIEGFLTVTSLNGLFSIINLIVFGAILLFYHVWIFLIFVSSSAFFIAWILLFQKKRAEYDYRLFSQLSTEQNKILEIIQGMQEIKLNNAEQERRWSWEIIQAQVFKTEMQTLSVEQYQSAGASFINELKNIFITIVAAQLVIDGQITLGMMLSISYIIGQLNPPLLQMIELVNAGQKAKLSMERLLEIQCRQPEQDTNHSLYADFNADENIKIDNLSFKYDSHQGTVLNNIELCIPANKVTAIVGASGSGKTTLMKLLLKIYEPHTGQIRIGNTDFKNISPGHWRAQCGIVMQEGFIFNDTIANNIALGQPSVDNKKLRQAIRIAHIEDFIDSLPLSIHTKLGSEGVGLSLGQKQRILIARAVYKNPKFIFFDEATSALDANNEKVIMKNLRAFFQNRTVIVVAHRLSTVQNADQIVVLDKNGIAEIGDHNSLLKARGHYYRLVKNQLQLERIGDLEEV